MVGDGADQHPFEGRGIGGLGAAFVGDLADPGGFHRDLVAVRHFDRVGITALGKACRGDGEQTGEADQRIAPRNARPGRAHRCEDFERVAQTILEAAAIFVDAVIPAPLEE